MRGVLETQLQHDHDPSLDAAPPEQLADQAAAQGVTDCAADLRKDPASYQALLSLPADERDIGWDAYNSTCASHIASRGDCVMAEIGAQRALLRMVATNQPDGAKLLVQTCALVLQPDPAMVEWRGCVDAGLALHAGGGAVAACKLSVPWHVAATGAAAGQIVTKCLAARD